jgi:septal ring factor EnvC (AmiA/AmiB activator)
MKRDGALSVMTFMERRAIPAQTDQAVFFRNKSNYRKRFCLFLLFCLEVKSMNEKIEAMKQSNNKDRQRVRKLQEKIKDREAKIQEMEQAELMDQVNSLSAKGFDVKKIISAIQDKDYGSLMSLIKTDGQGGTDTGSAPQI